jgi:alkaline phosphatase
VIKRISSILVILTILFSLVLATAAPASAASAPVKAKNVIFMIGDGMGFNDVVIGDYYQFGAAGKQVFESFPVKLAVSTYELEAVTDPYPYPILAPIASENPAYVAFGYDPSLAWSDFNYVKWTDASGLGRAYNNNSTDSSSSATAMATGSKTKDGYVGVNINKVPVPNVVEYAESLGKATGVVTTMSISHATPAGFSTHQVDRNDYASIFKEQIYNSALDVAFGCGAPDFDYDGKPVAGPYDAKATKYVGGVDAWADVSDGSVLGADANGDGLPDAWSVIRTAKQFQDMASGPTPNRVLGLAQVKETLQWYRSPAYSAAAAFEVPLTAGLPTLADMSKAALNVLDNDPDGFFLMIEGGAIDYGGHFNTPGRLVEEVVAFNDAVNAVVAWIEANGGWDANMLIVTADHETGYIWGPGSGAPATWNPIVDNGKGVMPGFTFNSDIGGFNWHTNSLVPLYVKGAGSAMFTTLATGKDSVRGAYMDNTEYIKAIKAAFEPASFAFSNLSISAGEVAPNQETTISLLVTNTGKATGDCTVTLKLNDVKAAEETVTIAGGANRFVFFNVKQANAGAYTISIPGYTGPGGSFAVVAPPVTVVNNVTTTPAPVEIEKTNSTLALVIGIIGAVIIIVLVVLLVRKKK